MAKPAAKIVFKLATLVLKNWLSSLESTSLDTPRVVLLTVIVPRDSLRLPKIFPLVMLKTPVRLLVSKSATKALVPFTAIVNSNEPPIASPLVEKPKVGCSVSNTPKVRGTPLPYTVSS